MQKKVRRICLAIIAMLLIFCATDYSVIPILMYINGGQVTLEMFFFVVIFANIEIAIWYNFGPEIILILQDLYRMISIDKPGLMRRIILLILRRFYNWEATKINFDNKLKSYFQSKARFLLMCLVGIFVPGVRVLAAITFGLTRWKTGLMVLMTLNTLHVAYSMGSWVLFKNLFVALYPRFFG